MGYLPFLIALTWGILAWRRPRWAVLSLPACLPIYVWRTHLGPLPTTTLELLFIATAFGITFKSGSKPWQDGWCASAAWRWPILAWLAATLLAIRLAPDHIAALGLWRAFVLEPLAYFILLQAFLKKEGDRRFVVLALAASTFFVTSWCVIQYLTGYGIPHPWNTGFLTRRATGPFPFPNAVSLYCAPLAALFFGLGMKRLTTHDSRLSRNFLWLAFFAATLATLLAKSVGGALSILTAVTTILIAKRRTRVWTLAALILSMIFVFAVPQLRSPTVNTLAFNGWSGRVRLWMWQETWQMLKDRPVLGAGLGAYPEVFKPYHIKTFIEIFQYPHNIILNFWSETGLFGLFALAWIVAVWIRTVLGRKSSAVSSKKPTYDLRLTTHDSRLTALPYALPLIAILVQGLVDVPYFKNDLAFAFWIFVALAASPKPPIAYDPGQANPAAPMRT
jgi:O-antigen ligase